MEARVATEATEATEALPEEAGCQPAAEAVMPAVVAAEAMEATEGPWS